MLHTPEASVFTLANISCVPSVASKITTETSFSPVPLLSFASPDNEVSTTSVDTIAEFSESLIEFFSASSTSATNGSASTFTSVVVCTTSDSALLFDVAASASAGRLETINAHDKTSAIPLFNCFINHILLILFMINVHISYF